MGDQIYLTYSFVLSWSLLEAMGAGCAIVASDTPPVREVICHGQEDVLIDFFDAAALVERICVALEDRTCAQRRAWVAREKVVQNYDLHWCCQPQQMQWVNSL